MSRPLLFFSARKGPLRALQDAVQEVLHMPHRQVRGGIIAVGRHGEIAMQFNTEGMARAAADSRGRWEIHVAE